MEDNTERRPNSRRRRKTKLEIFKEVYLPTIILGVAAVLILVFIIGAVTKDNTPPPSVNQETTEPTETGPSQDDLEVEKLLQDAAILAQDYDYQEAVDLLNSFQGDKAAYPALVEKIDEYTVSASQMVVWDDPTKVLNLSFHGLIADTKAFSDSQYGNSYNRNFVTIGEFQQILEDLYENGYILVDLMDIAPNISSEGINDILGKMLMLPQGKKPLLITQTNLSYYTYTVDGDGDGEPDKDGAGFASRLVVDESGNITCEMVNSAGETVTGAFDLVPILENFIAEHPDFSYKGARAILAPSGYDGIFGYRINAGVKTTKGTEYYNEQVQGATKIVDALKGKGYRLACYTYANNAYGKVSAADIQADLNLWNAEIAPVLGETSILVFAQNSAIDTYSGSKFNVLQNAGFRYYLGFGSGGETGSNYFVHNRLLVTGSQMAHNGSAFSGLFDAASILDPSRGTVPN